MHDTARKRVLIFPCGSEIGLEIHRALGYSTHVEVFGASSVASNHGRLAYRNYIETLLPYVDAPGFLAALNRLLREYAIDFIFPAHDSVVLTLAEHAEALACPVIASPRETCAICRSKSATYQRLHGVVPTPALLDPEAAELPFPIFLKPDAGQGSHGVHAAWTSGELAFYREQDPSLIALEYLPGSEYTVDCFTDRHGVLRFAGARERIRMQNGISVDTRPAPGEEFRALAERINKALAFRGVWFFQVKRRANGELVLMEIAPRVSGGMGLFRNLGVNFALLSLFDRMEQDVDILHNAYPIDMDRALFSRFRLGLDYKQVYIDLDDTLIFENAVPPLAIAFVFQCRNRGIPVHLVSRHAGELGETLQRQGLESLFASVSSLDRLACKSGVMDAEGAIFIDDSFAERKRVQAALGIPVFSVDALESLMDWRS